MRADLGSTRYYFSVLRPTFNLTQLLINPDITDTQTHHIHTHTHTIHTLLYIHNSQYYDCLDLVLDLQMHRKSLWGRFWSCSYFRIPDDCRGRGEGWRRQIEEPQSGAEVSGDVAGLLELIEEGDKKTVQEELESLSFHFPCTFLHYIYSISINVTVNQDNSHWDRDFDLKRWQSARDTTLFELSPNLPLVNKNVFNSNWTKSTVKYFHTWTFLQRSYSIIYTYRWWEYRFCGIDFLILISV